MALVCRQVKYCILSTGGKREIQHSPSPSPSPSLSLSLSEQVRYGETPKIPKKRRGRLGFPFKKTSKQPQRPAPWGDKLLFGLNKTEQSMALIGMDLVCGIAPRFKETYTFNLKFT